MFGPAMPKISPSPNRSWQVTQMIQMQQAEAFRATVLSGEGLQFLFVRKTVVSMSVEQRELLALLRSFLGGDHLSAAQAWMSRGRGYSMVPLGLLDVACAVVSTHVRSLESFITP